MNKIDIEKYIKNTDFPPERRSWLGGLIKDVFKDRRKFKDYLFLPEDEWDNETSTIAFIDDESLAEYDHNDNVSYPAFKYLGNSSDIFLCMHKKICEEMSKVGRSNTIFFPDYVPVDEILGLKLLELKEKISFPTSKPDTFYRYACLNRNCHEYRTHLIERLIDTSMIQYGYVTYLQGEINHPFLIESEKEIDDWYTGEGLGHERHNHLIGSVPVSDNVKNIFWIRERIPGKIMIVSECWSTWINRNNEINPQCGISEKSYLPFACEKIPLIIASKGQVDFLRKQGFDMFDDIVDHSYDNIIDHYERINSALELNKNVLTKGISIEYKDRLKKNFEFLLNDWLYLRLEYLFTEIEKKL